MARTRSDLGATLAPLYEVEGGALASGSELLADEIHLTHDVGLQATGERVRYAIRNLDINVAASTTFDEVIANLPEQYRIQGIVVYVDDTGQLSNLSVGVASSPTTNAQYVPLWAWNSTLGSTAIIENLVVRAALNPDPNFNGRQPILGVMDLPGLSMPIWITGQTTAGVGINITLRLLLAFFFRGNSPRGAVMPLPSW